MESTTELSRDAVAGALAAADLTPSQVGLLAARHMLGDQAEHGQVQRLGDSLRVTVNAVLKATADTTPARCDRADALAAALQRPTDDLTIPRLWGLREASHDERLIAPGGVAVLNTTEGLAWRTAGILMGANGSLPAQIADAAPAALFASDRERWIAANFDDLTSDEREYAIVVDAPYDFLRVLWHLDVAATSTNTDERRLAVEIGLVRALSTPELAEVGSPAAIALDTIEQAHDLADRRLRCDRLRDAPRPVYAEWGRQERNLRAAVELARNLVGDTT